MPAVLTPLQALEQAIKMLEELSALLGADAGLGINATKLQQLRAARDAEVARIERDDNYRAAFRELARQAALARSVA